MKIHIKFPHLEVCVRLLLLALMTLTLLGSFQVTVTIRPETSGDVCSQTGRLPLFSPFKYGTRTEPVYRMRFLDQPEFEDAIGDPLPDWRRDYDD